MNQHQVFTALFLIGVAMFIAGVVGRLGAVGMKNYIEKQLWQS